MYRWRNSGLGATNLVDSIAISIAQMEGFNAPGSIAANNNNPGNLRSGPGQIGTANGFAVFPDAQTGWAALDNQVQTNINMGLTLQQFFAGEPGVYAGYAPAADANNPNAYTSFVASQVAIPSNVPLSSLDQNLTMGPSLLPDLTSADASASGDSSLFDFSSLTDSSGNLSGLALVGIGVAAVALIWAAS